MQFITILFLIKILRKKNEDNKYKKLGQRAMSVFYQKRPISKSNLEKNKNKIDDNNLSNRFSGYKNNK